MVEQMGTALAATVLYIVFVWVLGLTRMIRLPSYGTSYFATSGVLLWSGVAFLLTPGGVVIAPILLAFSAWFAWSTRVPLFFKQFSYNRLVGDGAYRNEDVPNTVWKRPRLIERVWPKWL